MDGADETTVDKLIALGVISIADLEDVGVEPLVNELKLHSDLAEKLVMAAVTESERLAEESKQNVAEKELARQAKAQEKES